MAAAGSGRDEERRDAGTGSRPAGHRVARGAAGRAARAAAGGCGSGHRAAGRAGDDGSRRDGRSAQRLDGSALARDARVGRAIRRGARAARLLALLAGIAPAGPGRPVSQRLVRSADSGARRGEPRQAGIRRPHGPDRRVRAGAGGRRHGADQVLAARGQPDAADAAGDGRRRSVAPLAGRPGSVAPPAAPRTGSSPPGSGRSSSPATSRRRGT